MKNKLPLFAVSMLAVLLCSCATTSVQKTWKSPAYTGGPVKKLAVLAVADNALVRPQLEGRLARDIGERGQPVTTTYKLLTLPQIKEDKAAAVAALREQGADYILIVRLLDETTYNRQVTAAPGAFSSGASDYAGYGWYGYYDMSFMDMSMTYSSTRQHLVLDSSLFDLNTNQRVWSVVTKTVVKEDADRIEVADGLAAKVVAELAKDGMIR